VTMFESKLRGLIDEFGIADESEAEGQSAPVADKAEQRTEPMPEKAAKQAAAEQPKTLAPTDVPESIF
jgi:hypothetical protein